MLYRAKELLLSVAVQDVGISVHLQPADCSAWLLICQKVFTNRRLAEEKFGNGYFLLLNLLYTCITKTKIYDLRRNKTLLSYLSPWI